MATLIDFVAESVGVSIIAETRDDLLLALDVSSLNIRLLHTMSSQIIDWITDDYVFVVDHLLSFIIYEFQINSVSD